MNFLVTSIFLLALGTSTLSDNWCAKIYQHINYGGWEKVIQETNMLDLRGSKNNHASAVKVYPGCTLKLFNEHNNVGLLESHTTDVSFLSAYNDEVSSLSCTCPDVGRQPRTCYDENDQIVARCTSRQQGRCTTCLATNVGYDCNEGPGRQWVLKCNTIDNARCIDRIVSMGSSCNPCCLVRGCGSAILSGGRVVMETCTNIPEDDMDPRIR